MFIDVGNKPQEVSTQSKPEKYYPSIHIQGEFKSLKTVPIDKEMTIEAVVKVVGINKSGIEIEVRKIDFGSNAKDESIQDAIVDAMDETDKKK